MFSACENAHSGVRAQQGMEQTMVINAVLRSFKGGGGGEGARSRFNR